MIYIIFKHTVSVFTSIDRLSTIPSSLHFFCLVLINSSNPHNKPIIIVPILQVKKLRQRDN